MKRHWSIFWSPGFILGLVVLLVNDHYLKTAFHNFFTGKLSDLAGLFIFPIFFSAFFPGFKKHIYWFTVIGFIFWKCPFSDPLIQCWNSMGILVISRVVDYTDLITLLMVPVSYIYFEKNKTINSKLTPLPIIMIAGLAFIATSQAPQQLEVYRNYAFNYPLDTLQHRIFFHPNLENGLRNEWLTRDSLEKINPPYQHRDSLKKKDGLITKYLEFGNYKTTDTSICKHGFWADMKIAGNDQRSGMRVTRIWHFCENKKELNPTLLKKFEACILPYLNR